MALEKQGVGEVAFRLGAGESFRAPQSSLSFLLSSSLTLFQLFSALLDKVLRLIPFIRRDVALRPFRRRQVVFLPLLIRSSSLR
jgi:hypothetical protein